MTRKPAQGDERAPPKRAALRWLGWGGLCAALAGAGAVGLRLLEARALETTARGGRGAAAAWTSARWRFASSAR